MGNNVAVLIHTDELHRIEQSGDLFTERLASAIQAGEDYVPGFNTQLLPYAHADYTQVVLVGQNSIRRLDLMTYGMSATDKDADEKLMKMLAKKLGYSVTKD